MTTRIIQMVGYKSTGAPRSFREVGRMNSFSMRQKASAAQEIHLECIAPGYPKKQSQESEK